MSENPIMHVNFRCPEYSISFTSSNIVILPGEEGNIGVLPSHEDMVLQLKPGLVIADLVNNYFIDSGYSIITNNVIDIICNYSIAVPLDVESYIKQNVTRLQELLKQTAEKIKQDKLQREINNILLLKEYI